MASSSNLSAGVPADNLMSDLSLIEETVRNDPNTCMAIIQCDGVALLKVFRDSSLLVEKFSSPSMVHLSDNLCMTYCGNEADFRVLSEFAKTQVSRYQVIHERPISRKMLMKELSALLNQYTRIGGYRPFATSIFLASSEVSINETVAPVLYRITAGGEVYSCGYGVHILGDKSSQVEATLGSHEFRLQQVVDRCVTVLREVESLEHGQIQVTQAYNSGPNCNFISFNV